MNKQDVFIHIIAFCFGIIIGILILGLTENICISSEEWEMLELNNSENNIGYSANNSFIFKEIEWELCSSSGFWRAKCFTGSPCDEYKNDSAIKILNLTEENCKRLDGLSENSEVKK